MIDCSLISISNNKVSFELLVCVPTQMKVLAQCVSEGEYTT